MHVCIVHRQIGTQAKENSTCFRMFSKTAVITHREQWSQV